jgi:hypothetical protein
MKKTLFWGAAFVGILAIVALIGVWQEREVIVNFLKECRNQKVTEALEIDQLMSDSKLLD